MRNRNATLKFSALVKYVRGTVVGYHVGFNKRFTQVDV
jgi:hypothetical protein